MYQNMHYSSGKKLSPSKEEYLKAIFLLSEKEHAVRSIDLAAYLGVSKSSVNNAITILQEKGLVVKKRFLVACCKVNEETASKDACKIEHFISDESVMALEKYCSEIK